MADVEQIGAAGRHRVADERHLGVFARPDVGHQHRAGRVEVRIGFLQVQVLIQDGDELTEMGVLPRPPRALALVQDLVEGLAGGGQVGDRHELGPTEVGGGGLRLGRPDEQALLTVLGRQVIEPLLDRAVQVADRGEVLEAGHDVTRFQEGGGPPDRRQSVGVVDVHPLRTLQEHEVAESLLPERQQGQLDSGGVVVGRLGHVRPAQVGGGAHRREDVVDQGQVQHLLGGDMRDLLAPAAYHLHLDTGEAFVGALLEREGGEEVLAHDGVLELGGLAEHVDQRLTMLDHKRSLGRRLTAPRGDDLGQSSLPACGRRLAHLLIPLIV